MHDVLCPHVLALAVQLIGPHEGPQLCVHFQILLLLDGVHLLGVLCVIRYQRRCLSNGAMAAFMHEQTTGWLDSCCKASS